MQEKNTQAQTPPMQSSDEATQEQLQLAIGQGDAYQKALDYMVSKEAHGAETRAGDYLVGYAVEKAEGMYHLRTASCTGRTRRMKTRTSK